MPKRWTPKKKAKDGEASKPSEEAKNPAAQERRSKLYDRKKD